MSVPFVLTPEAIASATPLPAEIGRAERVVIALARHDGRATLRGVGAFRRWFDGITGARRPMPLADPRLEALRRFAVRCWRGEVAQAERERSAVADFGYRACDIVRIVAELGGGKAARA